MSQRALVGTTAAILLTGLTVLAAQRPPAFKRTVLQQLDLSAPGHEAVQAMVEFPAGSETGRHTHPGEEISYVEEGAFGVEIEGQPARTFKTGEAFNVPAGKIHNAHPATGGSAKVLAIYVVDKGKPLSTPVK